MWKLKSLGRDCWASIFLSSLIFCGILSGGPPARSDVLPAPDLVTRVAFGSCADQRKPQPIWQAVSDYLPDLFIFAGDNVYGDVMSRDLAELRAAYDRAAARADWQQLRREVPVLATWDDHDYGKNDGGAGFPFKQQSERLFLDFWQIPGSDERRRRPGVYAARIFGPADKRLQVILLDTRYFRSLLKRTDQRGAAGKERYLPDPDSAKTMLGADQWRWLETQLRMPADLRLIVSSIQVLADGHGWERWGNLPRERQRLFDLIDATDAGRVIFLSGDRHVGALYRWRTAAGNELYEVTSSGINKFYAAAREAGPNRLGALYGRPNFGTIDIDWWRGDIRLALRGVNGEPVRQQSIPIR